MSGHGTEVTPVNLPSARRAAEKLASEAETSSSFDVLARFIKAVEGSDTVEKHRLVGVEIDRQSVAVTS